MVLLKMLNISQYFQIKKGRRDAKSQIGGGVKTLRGREGVEIQGSILHKEHLSTTLLRFSDRKVHQTLLLSHKRAASNKIGTANPITVIFKICTVLILSQ